MTMPGRSSHSDKYRYGFNGQENDKELSWIDLGLRSYDPRIGKLIGVDPLTQEFPWLTPYQFAANTPVQAIDFLGLQGKEATSMPAARARRPVLRTSSRPPLSRTVVNKDGRLVQPFIGPSDPPQVGPGQGVTRAPHGWNVETQTGGYYIGDTPLYQEQKSPLTEEMKLQTATLEYSTKVKNSLYQEEVNPALEIQVDIKADKTSANQVSTPQTDNNSKKNEDIYVYRGGPFTKTNFTPRPGKDMDGLSVNLSALKATQGRGGKVQKLSVNKLRAMGFFVDLSVSGHGSIRPATQAELQEWANTRPMAESGMHHRYTTQTQSARVAQEEVEKPKTP